MKRTNRILSILLGAAIIFGVSSCKKDEPSGPGDGGGDILVSDGFYITESGVDPVSTSQLLVENVEDDGFTSQPREGFYGGYYYLTAGDYVVVKVESKNITETYGGAVTAATEETKVCETLNYNVVEEATLDGDAFAVSEDGLYRVTYDVLTAEVLLIPIKTAGIIGSATDIGWGDTKTIDIPGTIDATGAAWSASDITLREGEFKIRFNCAWFVDRRIDNTLTVDEGVWDANNGYMMWTNFGGTLDELTNGNDASGIQISAEGGDAPDEGVYTIDITWNQEDGFAVALTRTGDAEPLPEFPEAMYLVGAGTAYGWTGPGDASNNGNDAMHKTAGGTTDGVYWKICYLEAGQGFKISAASWADPNLGFGGVDEYDADGVTVSDDGGGNMDIATSGMYMIVLDLRNDMKKVSIKAPEVYGIGDAFGSWDEKTYEFTVDNVNKDLVSPALVGPDPIRSYTYHPWIEAWWHAEFQPNSGAIEYRNDGGDLTSVTGTASQVITYHFDDNTATVE